MKKSNAVINVAPIVPIDMQAMKDRAADLRRQIDAIEVIDADTYRTVASLLMTVKTFGKNIAAEWAPSVAKAHAAHKEGCVGRDESIAPFVECEKIAKQKLALYIVENEDIPETDGIVVGDAWMFEITDASKLPQEFFSPDLSKIKGVVKALKKEAQGIPGLRVWSEKQMTVRGAE